MTVDLSKAVKGATVKFRCGGSSVVDALNEKMANIIAVEFGENRQDFINYTPDGRYYHALGEHPFDIISITPPAFDWATVKQFDAFENKAKEVCYYLSQDPLEPEHMVAVRWRNKGCLYGLIAKEHLTRAPEHDIQVQS